MIPGVLVTLTLASAPALLTDPRAYFGPAEAEAGEAGSGAAQPSQPSQPAGDAELSMDDIFGAGSGDAAPSPTGGQDIDMDDVFGSGDSGTAPAGDAATGGTSPFKQPAAADSAGPAKRGGGIFSSGKLLTRTRILSSVYFDIDRTDTPGKIGRNENRLEFYFAYTPNKHIQIVGDIEPVFMGTSQARQLDDLSSMQMMNRFHVESDAAYVAINEIVPGLDVKLGRQIVVWGTGDKFNPTNNINADDLEDRPLFTEPIANQMVVVDYNPFQDRVWFQGVYVPLFYPGLLPPSAAAGLKDPYAEVPFAYDGDKAKIFFLQDRFIPTNVKYIPRVNGHVLMPENTLANGQAAAKIGSHLGQVDFSVSYYYGRHDIPLPVEVKSTQIASFASEGVDGYWLQSDAFMIYPRMQVIGADFATQIPFLGNMGVWGEMGIFIPKEQRLRIEMPLVYGVDVTPDDGVANPVKDVTGIAVRKDPFIKATVGADYTFGKHVYVQAQYLRGFIDEFGAGHIGNYVVGGTDLIFYGRHLIFRAFGLIDFANNNPQDAGRSGVIAPAVIITPPWGYASFEIGSFAMLGEFGGRTKFGQRATGTSIAYFKVIGTF